MTNHTSTTRAREEATKRAGTVKGIDETDPNDMFVFSLCCEYFLFFAFFAFFSVIRSNNCSFSHLSAALKACLPEAVYLEGVDFNVDSRCKVILDMLK